jgi:hypothetical protein
MFLWEKVIQILMYLNHSLRKIKSFISSEMKFEKIGV